MPGVKNEVYLHLVWATWDRLPILTNDHKQLACEEIVRKAAEHRCPVIATNGVIDHVHVLLHLNTTVSIATLVRDLKGASSHRLNEAGIDLFRWQGGYGVFPVAPADLDRVADYIRRQEQHHRQKTLDASRETLPD